MIVIHIESGLGNQMLSYCEYLALKSVNPEDDFYIENVIYDIPECNDIICQWNGYELERIFGIKEPRNIKSLFSEHQWNEILKDIRSTQFWNHNWNYPIAITSALNKAGLNIKNIRGDFSTTADKTCGHHTTWRSRLKDSRIGNAVRRLIERIHEKKQLALFENKNKLFLKTDDDIFTGQWLSFYRRGNGRERIDTLIKEVFKFPKFDNERDIRIADDIARCNAVAIHVRRGDALYSNAWCYKYGYFKDAVKYIRKHVDNPVFVFFTDPDSVEWCRENDKIFGINFRKENVIFVDWHKNLDSFRDMQLMALCKHAIITTSSFGWWGAYFIENPNKITISPYITIDTTHHI